MQEWKYDEKSSSHGSVGVQCGGSDGVKSDVMGVVAMLALDQAAGSRGKGGQLCSEGSTYGASNFGRLKQDNGWREVCRLRRIGWQWWGGSERQVRLYLRLGQVVVLSEWRPWISCRREQRCRYESKRKQRYAVAVYRGTM